MVLKLVGGILIVAIVLILIYYFCEGSGDLKLAQKEFDIYGLKDGFVPQSICFSKWLNCFFISGYMKNKNLPSRIYVVDKPSGNLLKYVVLTEKNQNLCGHFGGITCYGDNVWIATDGNVLRISQGTIKNAKNSEKIEIIDKFCSNNGADFCFTYGGRLWIGEFYKLGKFNTDISHHIKIDNKNNFHAMCFGYKILNGGQFGLAKPTADMALSVIDLCQGICVINDSIYTSSSYGLQKSNLCVFENVLKSGTNKYIFLDNRKIPLYLLSLDKLKKKFILPAMSEGLDCADDHLYILFENASKKYRWFTRKKIKNIFSFSMYKL